MITPGLITPGLITPGLITPGLITLQNLKILWASEWYGQEKGVKKRR